MLRIAVALALVLAAPSAHAEECHARAPGSPPLLTLGDACNAALVDRDLSQRLALAESLRDEHHDAIVMRNTGIALSAIGMAASIAGGVLLATKFCVDGCDGGGGSEQATLAGAGLFVAGQATAIVGFPLWAGGQSRAKRADRARLSLSAGGARITF